MWIKLFIILVMGVILYCLGSALFYMIRDKGGSTSMAKALSWRIGLSLALFLLLFLAYIVGWIAPHPISYPGAGS